MRALTTDTELKGQTGSFYSVIAFIYNREASKIVLCCRQAANMVL